MQICTLAKDKKSAAVKHLETANVKFLAYTTNVPIKTTVKL